MTGWGGGMPGTIKSEKSAVVVRSPSRGGGAWIASLLMGGTARLDAGCASNTGRAGCSRGSQRLGAYSDEDDRDLRRAMPLIKSRGFVAPHQLADEDIDLRSCSPP
jgi:hypothetical protein